MIDDPVSDVLYDRYARFFHAIPFHDFGAYCREGAILSRQRLAKACSDHTRFYTDETDQRKGVWARTFGNLEDFGAIFWITDSGIPNAYGPITIVLDRAVWKCATDVAITHDKNPGDADYDLAAHRLSQDQVRECFKKKDHYWNLDRHRLEVSTGNDSLPLTNVSRVIVEPLTETLVGNVREVWDQSGYDPSLVESRDVRHAPVHRRERLKALVDWARATAGKPPIHAELAGVVPPALSEWFADLPEGLRPPLRQWLVYTYLGTLTWVDE